ncbi:methyltransferase domain-containing protein [Patescibacteria group bacterium]|nr:methyltransferase domain-containing protein [Patescibacteria group bacterium]MBU1421480.1 methyltransferase domain-containing protein [Patescibacteria group bacterium]
MEKIDQFTIRQPEYLETFEAFHDSESLRQIALILKQQIDKKGEALKCLDSMAGTGIVGRKMKETFSEIQVVFQDKSPKMLKADSYEEEERIESDAAQTGLQDNNFDVVLCRGGLNNVAKEDYPKILKEYARVVKNDGVIIIQDHFARTEEERKIINSIETEIAVLEGREDETYAPNIQELKLMIQEAGGKVSDKQMFEVRLSLKNRFAAKGINDLDLERIKKILKSQTHIQYEEVDDDIVVIYPVFTVAIEKKSQDELSEKDITNAAEKGWQFLEAEGQGGRYPAYIASARDKTSAEQAPQELFSSILIADALPQQDRHQELREITLDYLQKQAGNELISFFEDRAITPDTDTNAFGYSILLESGRTSSEEANKVLDSILEFQDDKGKVQVWLSHERENRLDHVVGTNAVYLAHLLGREAEIRRTEEWIESVLDSEEYLKGSRYYSSPDSFLYFLNRLTKFPKFETKLKTKLKQHVARRIGSTEYPLDLAMRTILADDLGIDNGAEKQKLLSMQAQDGSWPIDSLYREGTKPRYFGNKSVPTALALQAISSK